MSSARIFPLEIEELIIDVLADDEDRSPLMTCSLVCQAYLAACRKRLFASIALNGNPDLNTTPVSLITAVFEQLLAARPEIAGYIRNLDYSIRPADLTNSTIQNSLKQISRLESLTFSYYHRPAFDWSNHPARPAFLHLLHLPTLTRLNVFAINNFAVSDLVLCVNLKRLDIGRHTSAVNTANFPVENLPTQPVQLHEFTAEVVATTAIIELSTARRPDGKPVVDFGSLSKITIVIERRLEDHVIQELFKRCVSLTDVNLSFWDPMDVRPVLATMLRPSMQTLKHIAVTVHVNDHFADPLFEIPAELEDMRTANIVESIAISVVVQTDETCGVGDAWGRLDTVLSKSGWSTLKRVSLTIEVASYSRVPGDNELEAALRKLPETQFTRLSASETVAFDFAVISILI